MRTTFGSFNIATSGLYSSQRSLDVVNNNISNANTEGYSRQVTLQRASLPIGGDMRGLVGTGVETYDIVRIKSEYLDNKYWGQVKSYSEWKTKSESLESVEALFNEPSDTGIRKVMDDLFAGMEELIKRPGDNTNRVNVIEKAISFAKTINGYGQQIVNNIKETNFVVKSKVEEVNAYALQIKEVNEQIFNLELNGQKSNALRDQRSTLIDKLSSLVNVSVGEVTGDNGVKHFNVKIGGIALVNHFQVNKLTVEDAPVLGVSDLGAGDISTVKWLGPDGLPMDEVKIEGGELKGLVDFRDGNGVNNAYRGLPYYLNQLNKFSNEFATEFNTLHRSGFGLNGTTNLDFFKVPAVPINCINLEVSNVIKDDPAKLAASNIFGGETNNENAKLMAAFRNRKNIFTGLNGTPDDYMKSVLAIMAVDADHADRFMTNSKSIVEQTNNKRLSESGVSLDEEMGNMVKFQHSYNASARMVTTLDGIMETMINRLGLVGR